MRSVGWRSMPGAARAASAQGSQGPRCTQSSAVRDDQGLTGQPRCRDAAGLGCTAVDPPHCHSSYGRMKEARTRNQCASAPHDPTSPAHLSIPDGLFRRSYRRTSLTERFQGAIPASTLPLGTSD
jgi:hypothetical protein